MKHKTDFDVVIVGAGITGAIIAKELCVQCKGLNILMLEAGTGSSDDYSDYQKYNDKYYKTTAKTPNSPYNDSRFSPSPSVLNLQNIAKKGKITDGYFVQCGPFPFLSNYNRNVGGTTLHWLGTTLRMCPNDFNMQTLYKKGLDWPIKYDELKPYYRRAEFEIGVAGEVDEQEYLGITYKKGYVLPMHKIPQSYLDMHMAKGLKGLMFEDEGVEYPIDIISTPQGRNGMPNAAYVHEQSGKLGYTPVGAVGNPNMGQRCEGNSNCVPICPVQAKYNALKTLDNALKNENSQVTLLKQSPVSSIDIDSKSKRVKCVNYKTYETDDNGQRGNIASHSVTGEIVILAANAIENAKILLASKACEKSKQVGKNLMDHLVMLTWGFFPKGEAIGAYRGPGSTSGIPLMRDGNFRKNRSAFRVEIGNWGWNWPANTPESTIVDAVEDDNKFGKKLINFIQDQTSRQFRIGWEMEQLPSEKNHITISDEYLDDLGNYRPIIHYTINDYEKQGAVVASNLSKAVFARLNIDSQTKYSTNDAGYFKYKYKDKGKDKLFESTFNGAGHVVGCHRMGTDEKNSVVNVDQRAHEHDNLYVAGCGSFPTLATSNPTLTMAALAYKTADAIVKQLKNGK